MKIEDYIIPAFYLLLLCAITWYFRKTKKDHTEFFLAGHSAGSIAVGLSVMVTTFSAVNYLALPGEVYGYGLYVMISLPAFFLAAWPVTRYWMPFFLKLHAVSIYSFLEERFDLRVRIFCSTLFLIWRIFWMSTALYASCKIITLLTGADFYWTLLICGCVAAAYSAIGGMRAVIWTDLLQFCVLFSSIVLCVMTVTQNSGFWSTLFQTGYLKPFAPVDWKYISPNPCERITLWSGLIGTFVTFLTRFGADQMVMQRYLSAKSMKTAQRGLWINGIASTLALGMLAVFGLALAVYSQRQGISSKTPPVKVIASLLQTLSPGQIGLIGAGLLAATMSSIDSGLNSCCAAYAIDFQDRLHFPRISPGIMTWILAVPVMLASAILLPLLNREHTLFTILNKTVNTIGTPLLAVMLCALFMKKMKAGEVFWGALCGTALTIYISCTVTRLALHYYAVLSLILTMGMILLLHLVFVQRYKRNLKS